MNCPECGAIANENYDFCTACGADLDQKPDSEAHYTVPRQASMGWIFFITAAGFTVILLLFALLLPLFVSPDYVDLPAEAEFAVEHRVVLKNPAGAAKKTYSLDFPRISDVRDETGDSMQFVDSEVLSPSSYNITAKNGGFDWLKWNGTLQPGGTLTISALYRMSTTLKSWDIGQGKTQAAAAVPAQMGGLLVDEWLMEDEAGRPLDRDGDKRQDTFIEPRSLTLQKLSSDIIAQDSATESGQILRSLFNYVKDSIRYPTPQEMDAFDTKYGGLPRHAIWTAREGVGDCDEQSALFITLARAAGIPAWMALGAIYDSSEGSWNGHGWAVASVPMKAGKMVNVTFDTTNREFALRDAYHLQYWEDRACNGSALEDYYIYVEYKPASPAMAITSELIPSSFKESGGTYRLYPEGEPQQTIPGFEAAAIVAGVVVAFSAVALVRRRRH